MKTTAFLLLILTSSFLIQGCSKSSEFVGTGNTVDWYESMDAGPFVSLVSDGPDLIGSGAKGVFLSTDCGLTWTTADSGLPLSGTYHVAVEGNTLIAGVDSPNGAFISTDEGTTWAKNDSGLLPLPNIKTPGNYEDISSMASYGPNIFAGIWYNGVYKTLDPCTVWSRSNNGMPNATPFTYAFVGSYLFAGTNGGIFLSTDNGMNWTQADSGLENSYHQPGVIPYVESMATNGREVYAGALDGELFVSRDFGGSWIDISLNLPANPGSGVYVGVEDSCLVAGTDKGVYFSTNDGATWTDISGNITTPVVASLFVTHGFIFVSTGDGVVWRTLI